jgi:integrase/recombinase XerC
VPSPGDDRRRRAVGDTEGAVGDHRHLRRLLAVCAGRGFEARRDTAVIMLLLDTGARRAELADLQLAHVALDLDVLLVLGKGRREWAPAVRAQGRRGPRPLPACPCSPQARTSPVLWLGLKGRLTSHGLVMLLRRRGRQAGLPALHPTSRAPWARGAGGSTRPRPLST